MGTSLKKVAKKAKDYKYVLLVMRHAKTEPFGDGGDAGRELTDKGRKQAKASPKAWPRTRWCRRALRAPAPPGPDRLAIACLRCSATTRRSTIVRVCTKVGCSRYLTSLPRPRRSIASCWCSAMSTVSIACQWLASSESDAMLLDMLNLGMSPASLAVFGSNEPFNQWQLHSGELIALLTAKDFE